MEKWGVILNPVAGEGLADRLSGSIEQKLAEYKPGYLMQRTEYSGHAGILSDYLLDKGCTHIVVIGGDGTVNEAAGNLVGKDVVFGIIPAGTGNDFMQMTGFSESFTDEEWSRFFNADNKPVDVGLCNGRYFFNGMGMGFDAEMTDAVTENRLKTGKISRSKYNYYIIKTLFGYKERKMNLVVNDVETEEQSFMTTCSIGRRFAGNYYLTPKAIVDDGLLDVLKIRPLNIAQRLSILTKVPSGTHLAHKKVDYFTTDKLSLSFEKPVPAHLDGELVKSESFDISIVKGGLNLIYNPNGKHYLSP